MSPLECNAMIDQAAEFSLHSESKILQPVRIEQVKQKYGNNVETDDHREK